MKKKISFERMAEINNRAIALEVDEGEYDKAARLFRQNARDYPSYITYNNLAWHVFVQVYPLLNFVKKSSRRILKYCKKALQYKYNPVTLRMLGELYYSLHFSDGQRSLNDLLSVQKEILAISDDIDDIYMTGIALFLLEKYSEALPYLDKVRKVKSKVWGEYGTYELYLACLALSGNKAESNRLAESLFYSWAEGNEIRVQLDPCETNMYGVENIYNSHGVIINDLINDFDIDNIMTVFYYADNYQIINKNRMALLDHTVLNNSLFAITVYSCKRCCTESEFHAFAETLLNEAQEENKKVRKDLLAICKAIKADIKPDVRYYTEWEYRDYYIGISGTESPLIE